MNTLTGKRLITVSLETGDGQEAMGDNRAEVSVRQIPIRDYEAGLKHFGDEIALVAFMLGKPREFALTLTPGSYEAVLTAGKELNERGFFAFCLRRIAATQQEQLQLSAALAQMPEDVRLSILAEGAKAMASTASSGSSSPQPPRPR